MASIVSAAIDVVLATPADLPSRVAALEVALQKNERAAEALAAARAARTPTEWTEKTLINVLSAKLRPTATVSKTQLGVIRTAISPMLAEDDLDGLMDELKAAKGPRAIARRIAAYDSAVVGLIVDALTE